MTYPMGPVHWHGLILLNEMDGPAHVTQPPIEPGESYTYEFTVGQQGTYFYHSPYNPIVNRGSAPALVDSQGVNELGGRPRGDRRVGR